MRASEELLTRAPGLREETGISAVMIARALGISRGRLYRWDRGTQPRDSAVLARYLRVLRGLQRHAEIEESREHWDWDWKHAGYRRPGSIAGRRHERAGPGREGGPAD